MQEAIAKAGALIEAMEYIRSFRGRTVVVKLGGSVLEDTGLQKKLLQKGGAVTSMSRAERPSYTERIRLIV